MEISFGRALWRNFLGQSPDWYKLTLLVFLVVNPVIFLLDPFVAGWMLVAEFIFTLAMALKCYPLLPGGLLALEWGAYLLLDFFYSYTIAKEKGWKFLPVEIILYPAFHFAYGFGSLCGIAALPKFVRAEKEKKKAGDGR